jgi:hypothetical protein
VLSDLALIGIVHRPPRTREELSAIRGVDGRSLRDGAAQGCLAAITAGLELIRPRSRSPSPTTSTARSRRPSP